MNGTTYYYVVSAVNFLGESPDSSEASATPRLPADMTVSAFTVPGTVAAGSSVTVSVTTKNQGTGFADPSTTRFYVSANGSVDASDTVLAEAHAVPALTPGMTSAASLTVTFPSTLLPGSYYLIAKSDADDVLFESVEWNNIATRSFAIGPDLTVASPSLPPVTTPGATISAGYTVRNQGANAAAPSRLDFYWSADFTHDSGDPKLASADIGALAPNTTQSGQASLVIPSTASIGTYYVFARADAGQAVPESWETNNNASATIRIGGDLLVTVLNSPSALCADVPFSVTDTTKNGGSLAVGPSATHFYLSPDATLSTGETLLGTRAIAGLAAGSVHTDSTTLVVPSGTPAGSYYLFAKADGANAVEETQEGNNTTIRSAKVGPDLVSAILSAIAPAAAGGTTVVSESVTNKGGASAVSSIVRYYLSRDFILDAGDVLLAQTRAVSTLAPNASSSGMTPIESPAGTAPGSYYVIVMADGGGAVAESSETNNIYYRQMRVD